MPLILHDYLGVGHDLSKGAFDSVSIAKPGAASQFLSKFLPKKFAEGWKQLSTDYRTTLKSHEPSMWRKMWNSIPIALRKGATKYKLARPLIQKFIAGIVAKDPKIGAIVSAAEIGLGSLLDNWGDNVETKTIRAKKGQWIFIESTESRRRRMMGTMLTPGADLEESNKHKAKQSKWEPIQLSEKIPEIPKKPKSVSLGFFIEPTTKNRVSVFSLDLGRAQEIEVSQLLECDPTIAAKLDADERLSTLRELYFYKYDGKAPTKSPVMPKPFFPGKRVRYKGGSFILLLNKHGKSLIEDGNGKTLVVDTALLRRGFGDSTPGQYDNHFQTVGKNNLYVGQWVYVPARNWVRFKFDAEVELGVIHQIAPEDRCYVFLALDGEVYTVDDDVIQPLNKHFQELYNAKKTFALFREAAISGTKATERFSLGQDNISVCVGKDYSDALTVEKPYSKSLEDYAMSGKTETQGKATGHNYKDTLDANAELRAKGISSKDLADPGQTHYVTETDNVTGTIIVGLSIAALAFALYA